MADTFWVVQDAKGNLIKLEINENRVDYEATVILTTNAGKLNDMKISPLHNAAVTIGDDGGVRLWDYVNQREFYSCKFPKKGTCVEWVPYNKKNQARVIIAGYNK